MQLFYCSNIAEQFELSKDESRHLIRSLRKSLGDEIIFTDGIGGKYRCKIIDDNPKRTCLRVLNKDLVKPESPRLTIAIAPTKNTDRIEWFLEKSTEIGIDRIIPFVSSHSERKVLKKDRLEKIIVSAMKQSLKYHLPVLEDLTHFDELISRNYTSDKYIAHLEKNNPYQFYQAYQKPNDVLIVIGPEGDFSPEEISNAKANGFKTVALGNSRLRTETAGIVACHSFNFINQSIRN